MSAIALLSATSTFLVATPFVYAITTFSLVSLPKRGGLRYVKRLTALALRGGPRTLVFQLLAWATWLISVLIVLPVLRQLYHGSYHARSGLLSTAGAVGSVFSLLWLIKAILAFEPPSPKEDAAVQLWRTATIGSQQLKLDIAKLPSRSSASQVVIGLGILWSVLGTALLVEGESMQDDPVTKIVYYALAAASFASGSFSTYGLGGHLRWSSAGSRGNGGTARWRFFQPFVGGTAFVATQILGWVLFSAALVGFAYLAVQAAYGVVLSLKWYAMFTGATALAAQVALAASLAIYKGPEASVVIIALFTQLAVITILYMPVHLFTALLVGSFLILPTMYATTVWLGLLFVYYCCTALGGPEHTGRREWHAFQDWLGRELETVLPKWLGSYELRKDGDARFDPQQKYIFGYAPHSYYPIFAGVVPLTTTFRKLFPGLRPVPLSASVIFVCPLLRDIACWVGTRAVSRLTFKKALRERRSVIVVPGGQAELLEAYRIRERKREFVLVTKHKGFVRLAIKEQAHLVPFLVLGELDSMWNIIENPTLARASYKVFGFPVPFLVVGKWHVLPLPNKSTGLRCIIGEPIKPPPLLNGSEPSQEQVEQLHGTFYHEMERLFHKHKGGFYEDDVQLVMHG